MRSICFVLLILLNLTIGDQVYKQPQGRDVRNVTAALTSSLFRNGLSPSADFDCSQLDSTTKYFLVDTDAGSDDGVGIFNLLGAQDLWGKIAVVTITAVNGNTNVDNVGRNVLKILKTAEHLEIPVYKGFNGSIMITPESDDYYGADGFGDFPFTDPPSEDLIQPAPGALALADLVKLCPGKFSLIALGPLTNVAIAARLNPNFIRDLDDIFILGGSVEGIGNVRPGVEFNIDMDVEAANIVFTEATKRSKPINLVPWETAYMRNSIPIDWRINVLGAIDSPQIRILNQAEAPQFINDLWIPADCLATAIAIDWSLVKTSETYHVEVETCGKYGRGVFAVDYMGNVADKTPNLRIIKEIDMERFKEMLLTTLNPWAGQTNGAARVA